MLNGRQAKIRQLDRLTFVLDSCAPQGQWVSHLIAGLGARVFATLYDWLIMATALSVGAFVLWANQIAISPWQGVAIILTAEVIYHLFFELITNGQSPGKNALGLRVVSVDGYRPNRLQLVIRNCLRPVDWLPCLYFAGGFHALWHVPAQRWGDVLARTIVIYHEPFRQTLRRIGCGAEIYSTSQDAYLLESYCLRADFLDEEVREFLGRRFAERLMRKYAFSDPFLNALYHAGDYHAFLQHLYLRERAKRLEPPAAKRDGEPQ